MELAWSPQGNKSIVHESPAASVSTEVYEVPSRFSPRRQRDISPRRRLWDVSLNPETPLYGPWVDVGAAAADTLRASKSQLEHWDHAASTTPARPSQSTPTRSARTPAVLTTQRSPSQCNPGAGRASPAPPYIPNTTQRAAAKAAENRHIVLHRKLCRPRIPAWVVADWTKHKPVDTLSPSTLDTHKSKSKSTSKARPLSAPGRARAAAMDTRGSNGLLGHLTPQEMRRLPAGTYRQLEQQFIHDYTRIQSRLDSALSRCAGFQQRFAPAPPPAWHTPYPAAADLTAAVGGGPSLDQALATAAQAAVGAAVYGHEVGATLRGARGAAAKAAAVGSVGVGPRSMLVGAGSRGSRGAAAVTATEQVLLQQPAHVHYGAAQYTSTTAGGWEGVAGTGLVQAPWGAAPTSPHALGGRQGAAASTPTNTYTAPHSTIQQPQPVQGMGALPSTPTAAPTTASQPSAVGLWGGEWSPTPLIFPESTHKFFGRGDVSQALAAVFASAARDAGGCGGLSHRERLQAGIRDLQAQWYGPLVP